LKDSLAAAAAEVRKEAGFVNCIIAKSGATATGMYGLPEDCRLSFEEVQKHLWDLLMERLTQAFEVHTTACFYTLVAFLRLLDAGNSAEPAKTLCIRREFILIGSVGAFSKRPGMDFA
jgi:NAD(P)-dependent dehydrogenase (short-subunit alcohol dehydrogenase family)